MRQQIGMIVRFEAVLVQQHLRIRPVNVPVKFDNKGAGVTLQLRAQLIFEWQSGGGGEVQSARAGAVGE